jgi:hypothetical protein
LTSGVALGILSSSMPPLFLRLNAICRRDRNEVTALVVEGISHAGGWILDHHLYSNISLCIILELPAKDLGPLVRELERAGLDLRQSQEAIQKMEPKIHDAMEGQTLVGTLQITFLHDEPDLKRQVPPIPG